MRFVAVMAVRELRASWRRLVFFFLCIAIGVGAIVALRSVIQSVRHVFAGEARVLIGADLVIRSNQALDAELTRTIDARLAAAGATSLSAVEIATMARAASAPDGVTRIVEVRGVEAGFPFYGTVELADGATFDHGKLADFGALVRPELLTQLGVDVGDGILIGTREFQVRGVITLEPGRRLGAFSLGPRVFVDLADLEHTGLLTLGSRASFQRLVKVPDPAFDALVTAFRSDLSGEYARLRSYRATEDDVGEDFARAENYLSLVGLVIVILGGIGISSVTRVFVQQKLKSIAILKCLGCRSSELLAIYMTQVMVLGLAGSLLGVAVAGAAIAAVPAALAAAATPGIAVSYGLTWPAIAQGLGIGLLVSILFSLVPLLDVRHVKPSLLLREERRPPATDPLRRVVLAVIGAGLVALTVWQAGSLRIGVIVAVGFAATAVVLQAAGWLLIRAITPLAQAGSFPLRHAVRQLSRPGSQARVVLLAVGLGSFLVVGVRSLQENLISEFTLEFSADAPDTFLIDIQRDQVEGLGAYLASSLPPTAPAARLIPVLRARVTGVEGRTVSLEDYEDVRGRGSLAREYTVTYRPGLEANETVVAGTFWGEGPPVAGEVSIEASIRDRFGIDIGDRVRFDVLGRVVEARVSSVREVNWTDGRAGGFMFVFSPDVFADAPHGYISFFRGPETLEARARLQSGLVSRYPNVSVIDGREMLDTIRAVVDNVTLAVTVVGSLVVVSGLLILVGAVAMTKFRRVYEAAILKTLGATRRIIASILVLEYGVLGAVAGTIGSVGAMGLTWGISEFALDIPWRPLSLVTLAGVLVTSVLVAVVGVSASWEVLRRKPLASLRAE